MSDVLNHAQWEYDNQEELKKAMNLLKIIGTVTPSARLTAKAAAECFIPVFTPRNSAVITPAYFTHRKYGVQEPEKIPFVRYAAASSRQSETMPSIAVMLVGRRHTGKMLRLLEVITVITSSKCNGEFCVPSFWRRTKLLLPLRL